MPDSSLASYSGTELARDQLLAGPGPFHAKKVTLLSGQNVVRGAVLGKVTADGKYKLSATAAGDGSETADVIVVHPTHADGADIECLVYWTGSFNWEFLTVGTGHTLATVRDALRLKGMYVVTSESADDPA